MLRSLPTRAALALALSLPATAQATWRVDDGAAPGGDGLSWATAFDSIEKAFALCMPGDRVWVAEGHYRPMIPTVAGDPRSVTFLVPQGVRFYGGFRGFESTLAERVGLFDRTILDGDVGVPGDAGDNAYHVVSAIHPDGIPPGATRIDGFTITGGNADSLDGQGGGVKSFNSATRLENCIVVGNRAVNGGGAHAQPASLHIVRCTFRDNVALNNGGATWGQALFSRVTSTVFEGNRAGNKGGAAYVHSTASIDSIRYDDCLFVQNSADVGGAVFVGGGMYTAGRATLRNCTVAYNRAATRGGGLRAVTGPAIPADCRLYSCIVWGNQAPLGAQLDGRHTVNHCDVEGGAQGLGNLSADPLFEDPLARDFRLRAGSPCIDAGNLNFLPPDQFDLDDDGDQSELVPLDLAGGPRLVDDPATPDTGAGALPWLDIGAYER